MDTLERNESLISVADAARLLDVSTSTVRRLARVGRLPAVRVGSQLRFDRDTLLAPAIRTSRRGPHPDAQRIR